MSIAIMGFVVCLGVVCWVFLSQMQEEIAVRDAEIRRLRARVHVLEDPDRPLDDDALLDWMDLLLVQEPEP